MKESAGIKIISSLSMFYSIILTATLFIPKEKIVFYPSLPEYYNLPPTFETGIKIFLIVFLAAVSIGLFYFKKWSLHLIWAYCICHLTIYLITHQKADYYYNFIYEILLLIYLGNKRKYFS